MPQFSHSRVANIPLSMKCAVTAVFIALGFLSGGSTAVPHVIVATLRHSHFLPILLLVLRLVLVRDRRRLLLELGSSVKARVATACW